MAFETGLAIYAAVISTFVFLWRLYEFMDDRKGKIRISLHEMTVVQLSGGNLPVGTPRHILSVIIINKSKQSRQIQKPAIKTKEEISKTRIFALALNRDDQTTFPHKLDTGEQFEYKISLEGLHENFKAKGVSKIQILISDTLGGRYESKWHSL